MRPGSSRRWAAQGFLLFELVVVLMIASLLATWGVSRWAAEIDDHSSASTAAWFIRVGDAVQQELKVRASAIEKTALQRPSSLGQRRSDWVETLSVEDLIAAGHLPTDFMTQPSLPYDLAVHLRQLKRSVCVQSLCGLEALLVLRPKPSGQQQALDSNRLGKMLTALSGSGLVVHPLHLNRLKGAQVDLPNPPWATLDRLPAGTVGMHVLAPVLLRPRDQFGGAYVSPHGGDCRSWGLAAEHLNPLTGNCSCPEGYIPRLVAEWRIEPPHEHSLHSTGVRSYICVAPL